MQLSETSPDLENARAVDAAIGEEGDDRPLGLAQPASAVAAGDPPRETVAERLVVPVGFAALAHALSMGRTGCIFKRSLDNESTRSTVFNGSLEFCGGGRHGDIDQRAGAGAGPLRVLGGAGQAGHSSRGPGLDRPVARAGRTSGPASGCWTSAAASAPPRSDSRGSTTRRWSLRTSLPLMRDRAQGERLRRRRRRSRERRGCRHQIAAVPGRPLRCGGRRGRHHVRQPAPRRRRARPGHPPRRSRAGHRVLLARTTHRGGPRSVPRPGLPRDAVRHHRGVDRDLRRRRACRHRD